MIFEQIATGGCQSYLIGCNESSGAALIDPEISQIDHYIALAARDGLRTVSYTHLDVYKRQAYKVGDRDGRLVEMLLFAGAVYFVICFAFSQLVRHYQKKLKTA